NDPEITNHVLWPTELKRQNFSISENKLFSMCSKTAAKVRLFLKPANFSLLFFRKKQKKSRLIDICHATTNSRAHLNQRSLHISYKSNTFALTYNNTDQLKA
ncbi:MAG: hypothetical protein MJZ32_08660, partial [Bacteroidaceae bacterium]|nr:hypothetical protein [Bacteroidaceae bacterium]